MLQPDNFCGVCGGLGASTGSLLPLPPTAHALPLEGVEEAAAGRAGSLQAREDAAAAHLGAAAGSPGCLKRGSKGGRG